MVGQKFEDYCLIICCKLSPQDMSPMECGCKVVFFWCREVAKINLIPSH